MNFKNDDNDKGEASRFKQPNVWDEPEANFSVTACDSKLEVQTFFSQLFCFANALALYVQHAGPFWPYEMWSNTFGVVVAKPPEYLREITWAFKVNHTSEMWNYHILHSYYHMWHMSYIYINMNVICGNFPPNAVNHPIDQPVGGHDRHHPISRGRPMAATASWYHVHRLPDEPMMGWWDGDLWCSEAYAVEEMTKAWLSVPIGSMYAIYGNIYHQYNTPNVTIYIIHGSYG